MFSTRFVKYISRKEANGEGVRHSLSKIFVSIIFSVANFYVYVKKIVVAKFTKKE